MSDLKLAGTYRDHAITFTSWANIEPFKCSDLNLSGKTWESLKPKIDKALKADYKRVPVVVIRSDCEFGEITSLCDEDDVNGYGDNKSRQAWVVSDKGRRSKEPLSSCVLKTPENMAALKLAGEEKKQADAHNAKSWEIIKAIPRVQVSDVLETGKAVTQ
jgi:hypothetical protein